MTELLTMAQNLIYGCELALNPIQIQEFVHMLKQNSPSVLNTTLMDIARRPSSISNLLIQLLLNAGSDPNTRDEYMYTPLMTTCMFDDSGASTHILIKNGADLNLVDSVGYSALIIACMFNNDIGSRLLINAGADVNLGDLDNRTPLMSACICSKSNKMLSIIELMISVGADINAQDINGRTSLTLTQLYTKNDMANLIIEILISNKLEKLSI